MRKRLAADFSMLLQLVTYSHLNLGSRVVRTQLDSIFSTLLPGKVLFSLILTANVFMSDNFLPPSPSPLNLNYRLHSKR